MTTDRNTNSLYISYNGITEPITKSQVLPYLKGLARRGIKFYLLTFEKANLGLVHKEMIRRELDCPGEDCTGIKWFSLDYHKRPTVPATLLDIITGFFYSLYIIIRYRIDIVHGRAIVAALIGWPAARLLSKWFIFDTRGIDSEEYVDAGAWKRGGIIHRVTEFLENIITRSSDHVIVLTERFLAILKVKYRNDRINFSVIPCAVDIKKFRLENNKTGALAARLNLRDKFVIVYAGSLGTWYMFSEMLDFFKVATHVIENAHLLILTHTDGAYARRTIEDSGLDPSRFTLDTTTYDIMPEYLSCCDAGIFFIKPVFSKISSSPVKFGEYLASGLPVIVNSDIGDTEEIAYNNRVGVIVRDFDTPGYQKAIGELSVLLKETRLSARCRVVAEKYLSLDKAIDSYYEIYSKL